MVLLTKIQEGAIVENLKKRFQEDLIYVSFCNPGRELELAVYPHRLLFIFSGILKNLKCRLFKLWYMLN